MHPEPPAIPEQVPSTVDGGRPGRAGSRWRQPWVTGLIVGLAVTVTATVSLSIVCVAIRDVLLDDLRNYLRRTVETTAVLIDGERHARLADSLATGSPEYLALSSPLAALLETNPDIRFAYTGLIRGDSMFYVLDGDRSADRAYVMEPDQPTAGELELSRIHHTVVETGPSATAWGIGIRAYAPIRGGSTSHATAYVGITISAARYHGWMERVYHTAALGFLVALVLAVIAGSRAARVERTRFLAEAELARARELGAAAAEDRRAMELRLASRHKMEALGTLAGGVAHDFNNLLAVILGNAEILAADAPEGSFAEESVVAIQTAAARARDVVRRILLFAHPEAERLTPISLGPVIEETVHLLASSMPSSIAIVWHQPPQAVTAIADPSQLAQVLMNLCVNASQALPDQRGTIDCGLTLVDLRPADALRLGLEPGPYARVEVRDSGVGMSEEVRARIFEPFFTTKGVGNGSGLGLAVVEGVVRGHRGAIEVESVPGQGSTFAIYLPASAHDVTAVAGPASAVAPSRGGAERRILLLDDDPMVLKVGSRVIHRAGYDVDSHADVDSALTALAADPEGYAALVTDRTMPKLSGLEVACRARLLSPHLPVVLLTGKAEPGDAEAPDIAAVVCKPADSRTLLGAIERVIAMREQAVAVAG